MRYSNLIIALLCCTLVATVFATSSWINLDLENNRDLRRMADRLHFPTKEGPKVAAKAQFFTQKLNHFDATETRTWKQKYVVNDTYYTPNTNSPIFIFLAGEAPEGFFGFQEVEALHWAQQYKALYVVLEHRYYGDSIPLAPYTSANMKFLSSQQALADAAWFIESYNKTLTNPGPWVVFGCSYSGALSAWFRAKYPNSVVASVAPSGPVFANTNYTGYYGQFATSASDQPGCVDSVKSGVSQISQLLSTAAGRSQLEKEFNSCTPLTDDNIWYFKFTLMEAVGGSDQMDNPPDWPLNRTCKQMTSTSDPVANWAKLLGNTGRCNSFEPNTYVHGLRITVPNSNRAWYWQKCTEFGFFKPSYPGTSIFWGDVPVEPFIESCEKIFDIKDMKPNTEWTNSFYGGYNLLASNVLFTNGLKDPWHLLSINHDVPPPSQVQAVTYSLGHCASLIAPTNQDPPSLIQARKTVDQFLGKVLAQNNKQ